MDPISQQQLLTSGGAAEGAYIDDVFKTTSYNGTTQNIPVTNGIALGSGNAGRSVLFNAANKDYISIPNHADLGIGTDDFTIEAWVYHIGDFPSYANVFGNWTGQSGSEGWIMETVGSGSTSDLEFYYFKTDGNFFGPVQGAALTKNQWHHVAVCRAANTIRVFIDGVMYGSGSSNSDNIRQGGDDLTIGGWAAGTGGNWNGYISNVRYVKGQGLYTANFTPSTEALTTTSQGATASNVKLLCCNQTTVTGYDKSFGTLTRGTNQTTGQGGPNPRHFGPFSAIPADVDNYGGMVWLKSRDNGTANILYDTMRGRTKYLRTDADHAQTTVGNSADGIRSFDNAGFLMGDDLMGLNRSNENVVAWTFRKQKKFFDQVEWTGNNTIGRVIPHNLGSVPGCIMVKCTSHVANWAVYHVGADGTHPQDQRLKLNNSNATSDDNTVWNDTVPTASGFTIGDHNDVNTNGRTYVAYLFAHDAGGFGENGTENAIQCGSYMGNGSSSGPLINIGWQPQWIMTKGVQGTGANGTSWVITDQIRGWRGHDDELLDADQTGAEYANVATGRLRGNGVELTTTYQNTNNVRYIYIAIRDTDGIVGKRPATGEDAFQATFGNGTAWNDSQAYTTQTGWDPAYVLSKKWNMSSGDISAASRIRFKKITYTNGSAQGPAVEVQSNDERWDKSGGIFEGSYYNANYEGWMWKKGPGCDVLTYKGNGQDTPGGGNPITHNLGGVPELIITKNLDATGNWTTYSSAFSSLNYYLLFNLHNAENSVSGENWNPTATTFNPIFVNSDDNANKNGDNYQAVLFRSVNGISKVGTYTGQATDLDLNLGFTPRFFMVKNITQGVEYITQWAFWDNRRGIATGNDSFLQMNHKTRDTTSFDLIDPIANGLRIRSVANKGTNPNDGTNWSANVICNSGSFDFGINRSFSGVYPVAGPDAVWDTLPFSRTGGNYITISFNTDVSVTIDSGHKFIVYTAEDSTATAVINGSTQTSSSGKVHEFSGPGTLTNWSARGNSTQGRTYFTGMSANGWLLKDSCTGGTCGGDTMTNKTGDKYIYYAHA